MAQTNKEAVTAPFDFKVPEQLVTKVMTDHSVVPNTNYSTSETEKVDLAVADLCLYLVQTASEKEGGYGVAYNPKKLKELRTALLRKYGVSDDSVGGIKAISVW